MFENNTNEGPNRVSQVALKQESYPSAAQLARESAKIAGEHADAAVKLQLRMKSIEFAASFDPADPIKLAKDIYEFLSNG